MENTPERHEPACERIFLLADELFDGIDYDKANSRSVRGTLDFEGYPILEVGIAEVKNDEDKELILHLGYLLTDGCALDKSAKLKIRSADGEPEYRERVITGWNWGEGVIYQPFSEVPIPLTEMMQLALEMALKEKGAEEAAGIYRNWGLDSKLETQ